jgi:hypothetical protein
MTNSGELRLFAADLQPKSSAYPSIPDCALEHIARYNAQGLDDPPKE